MQEPAAASTAEHPVPSLLVSYPQLGDLVKELILGEFSAN
jgi:hypothetical protein